MQRRFPATILITEFDGGGICPVSLDGLNCSQTIDLDNFKQLFPLLGPQLRETPAASCNGLILISDRRYCRSWAIWNPSTRRMHELGRPCAGLQSVRHLSSSVGFGYDAAADDYRVVRIGKVHLDGVTHYRTLVYSLKLRGWRKIQDCPYHVSLVGDGVFLNGALHWQSREGITALHLGKEEYSLLPRPLPLSRPTCASELLDALGGYLFLSYYHENKRGLDVWLMKDYGVEASWMKLCSIDILSGIRGLGLRPVAYLESRRQVFVEHLRGGLYWLDLDKNTVKEVAIENFRSVSFSHFSPGNLLRLDSCDGAVVARSDPEGKRKRKRTRIADFGRLKLKCCLRDQSEDISLTSF